MVGGDVGPLNYGGWVSTAGTGQYSTVMPIGAVKTALLGGVRGYTTGTLTAAGPLTLDVVAGASGAVTPYSSPPTGADNFDYRSGCDGAIRGGEDLTPYSNSYTLRVNGVRFDCRDTAAAEVNGRQIAYGPSTMAGLAVTRRVFVPASGGFARYLETFTNASATPITVEVLIESDWSSVANLFTSPSETGQTFAVTTDGTNGASSRASAAHVFAGPGAATAPVGVEFQPLVGVSVYRYQITVPAGGAVTLMHFTAQRAGNDVAGARAQAESLANLTDSSALAGMTAEEQSRVINFRIP